MGPLDEPVGTLLGEPGRRRLDHLLDAAKIATGRGYIELYKALSAENPALTAREAFRRAGVHDVAGVPEQVAVFEHADRVATDLAETERQLLESAPPVKVDGDPFVTARKLSPRYQGPEGRRTFQLDSETDPDLVERLERQARQAKARSALNHRLRALAADANAVDTSARQKLHMLDRHAAEGRRELEQAVGATRRLVQPTGYTGDLRELEAAIAGANRVIALQVDDSRAAAPTGAGVDGDVTGAVERLHRRLQSMASSPAVDNYGLTDQINDFHRRLGGLQ
jgi:hypothetical protein